MCRAHASRAVIRVLLFATVALAPAEVEMPLRVGKPVVAHAAIGVEGQSSNCHTRRCRAYSTALRANAILNYRPEKVLSGPHFALLSCWDGQEVKSGSNQ